MRSVFLLIAFTLLNGCGSGGSGDSSSNNGGVVEPSEPLSDSALIINIDRNNIQFYAKGADSHSDRYLEYNLKHIDDESINADLWRLYELYESSLVSDSSPYSLSRVYDGKPIANTGEWEAAIREVGAGDFIGGYHGDEVLTSVSIFVNGEEVEFNKKQYVSDSFSFVQKSNLYSWYTGEVIATHVKEYNFSQNGFVLNQTVTWNKSVDISRAYLAMLPVKRKIDYTSGVQITDTAWYWPSGSIQDVYQSGFPVVVTKSDDEVWLEGAESRFRAEVKMNKHPNLSGYNVFVNNVDAYNKVYFDISGSYTTTPGEVWNTTTTYNLTTYN